MLTNRISSKLQPLVKAFCWSLVVALMLLTTATASQNENSSPEVKDFEQRISKYLDAEKAQNISNKPSASANKIENQKKEAEQKVREARPTAKQGDIFTPEIGAYFKKQLAATFQGPDGEKIRKSLNRAEPLPNIPLRVNQKYPRELPLQSMPPTLLLNLPRLPNELQYRIVGTTLVLYDVSSDLIADLLPDALPGGVAK
ncbi:MAG TPA: hypothetical protein VFB76_18205 [Candidatus Angelobacter sp.]|nr:hypothetical protein [Candidatus Angelobacter sp.]